MNLFAFLIRASWKMVLLATLLGGISGIASVGLIAMIHMVLRQPAPSAGGLAWAFAGLCLVVLLTKTISQVLLIRLSQGAVSRMFLHLCSRIPHAPLRHLEQIGSHRLLATLTGDVAVVAQAMNGIPVVCVSAVTLACGLAYLGWLEPGLSAAMLGFLMLGVASYRLTSKPAGELLSKGREDLDLVMRHVRSMIEGIKELKLHRRRREVFLGEVLRSADASLRRRQIAGFSIQAVAVSWGRLLFFVAIGLLLFGWPKFRAVDGATLTGYTLAILYLMTPLERIMAWLPLLTRARVALGKVEKLGLSVPSEQPGCGAGPFGGTSECPTDGRAIREGIGISSRWLGGTSLCLTDGKPSAGWNRLEVLGVTHPYQRERDGRGFVLGPIELSLRPGEIVFITGGNGSGKTTLAKLITGLYLPDEGEIRVDGQTITSENREQFRQLFSVVFAEATLFDSLLGLDARELDARARDHLARLHLDHEVDVTDGVFSTTELSKGQRKRLALLTAYLEDRPIYVFDEWAADQDPLFKEVFYTRILPELKQKGKAVLVISHDERYYGSADRIVALCDGKVTHGDWQLARILARGGRPAGTQSEPPADQLAACAASAGPLQYEELVPEPAVGVAGGRLEAAPSRSRPGAPFARPRPPGVRARFGDKLEGKTLNT